MQVFEEIGLLVSSPSTLSNYLNFLGEVDSSETREVDWLITNKMCTERQRLRPWLEDKINSGKVPGLYWRDKDKKEFRVSWKHAGKPDFNVDKDAMLFKLWAEHTGKYRPGESADPSTWKTRFRCALHKMPDVEEVRVPHSLDEKEPYRVFRFTDKEGGSPKRNSVSPKADKTATERRHPYARPKNPEPVVIRPPLDLEDLSYNLKNYPGFMGRSQDSPRYDSSDSSIDDSCDLDAITPTITPYTSCETMLPEETASGNFGNHFFPYANGQGFHGGDFMSNGFLKQITPMEYSARKEIFEAVKFAANGQMTNGSMYDNGQTFLQHFMAANPGGLMNMKLWWGGVVIPDEASAVSSSTSTHLNMDNGLIEPTGMELDDEERIATMPYMNESTGSSFSRTGRSPLDGCDSAMYIRIFYGSHEVLSTETRLVEGERFVRFFYGSPIAPERVKMDIYSKVYGPPGAKQIKLPEVKGSCPETMKVMSYLTRGILLEITEAFDILATRLALTRVFYANGRKAATKLQREKCTKVFDYRGKFLPTLKESRNGNCEHPSYDVTFYLGRGDSSLVSIVVTNVKAKMSLHNECTGEKFLSEPNLNDQLATSLEQDCMY